MRRFIRKLLSLFHLMVQVELSGHRRISFLEDALGVFATDNGGTGSGSIVRLEFFSSSSSSFFFAGWSISAEFSPLGGTVRTDDSFRYFLRNLPRFNIAKCDCKRKGSEEDVVSAFEVSFDLAACNIIRNNNYR